jgi:NDP-sugar pyrophosphorylase family protein
MNYSENIKSNKLYTIITISGGKATRLFPASKHISKFLYPILGRPFIFYQLDLFKKNGFENVIISTDDRNKEIFNYVRNGNKWGLNIAYSFDGDKVLGTAGAVKKATSIIKDDSFFVIYGDSYLPIDYQKMQRNFEENKKPCMMSIYKNESSIHNNNIVFDGTRIVKYERNCSEAQYIDYGLGIYNKDVFDLVPENEFYDMNNIAKEMIDKKSMDHYISFVELYGVGNYYAINKLTQLLMNFYDYNE